MSILLSKVFDSRSIKVNLEAKTKEEAFIELVDAIADAYPEYDQTVLFASIWERENKMSTGIASGIAIPHGFCRGINKTIGAIGISRSGIEYGAADNEPVHVVFMLAMGEQPGENHLHILKQILSLTQSGALASLRNAKDAEEAQTVLSEF